jgi:hypothetical protein
VIESCNAATELSEQIPQHLREPMGMTIPLWEKGAWRDELARRAMGSGPGYFVDALP